MKNITFEEFYYSIDQQIHSLSEVQDEYEKNNGDISKYRHNMLCPECQNARLRFTRKTSKRRAFLSKYPSSEHAEGCSYIHDYATKNEIRQFVKSLSDQEIKDRLETVLNQLLPKKKQKGNGVKNGLKKNPFVIEVKDKKGGSIRKSIPRKSIRSWFDKSEENQLAIFYGRVKLEVKKVSTKEGTRFKLNVKINKGNNWIIKTTIFRNTIKDKIDEDRIYDIAILGYLKFYGDFPQIMTETFSSIMFRESIV